MADVSIKALAKQVKCGFQHFPPGTVVVLALSISFIVFLALDTIEHAVAPGLLHPHLRLLHFLRGLLATAGGMLLVWGIMSQKEKELISLRDHFAEQLKQKTSELQTSIDDQRQAAARLKTIVGSMGIDVIGIDSAGSTVFIGEPVLTVLGINELHLLGKSVQILAKRFEPLNNALAISSLSQAISARKFSTGDAVYNHPDGSKRVISWSVAPVELEGKQSDLVLTFSDITERQSLQRALLDQREDFLNVISHRLRTPVLANERTVSLLLQGEFGGLQPEQIEILKLLIYNNQDLDRIVRMLIDIYKYKNGAKELQLRTHDLNDILDRLSGEFITKAAERGIDLQIKVPEHPNINCDATELEVMIGHLMENAVKHARSKVVVSWRLQAQSIELRIFDDGCGIAEADIGSLFDRFYVSSSNGKFSAATGAGLCLCAEIAKAHGGTIECQSKVGQGSCFIVNLPSL